MVIKWSITEWIYCGDISNIKYLVTCFSLLANFAILVLILPHSNAVEEHVFSLTFNCLPGHYS